MAGWLAEKAKTCGYQTEPELRTENAKIKKAAGPATKATNSKTRYVVKIRDFVPMAASIAAHKPGVKVPRALAPVISRVIDQRNACTEFHQAMEESPTKQTQTRTYNMATQLTSCGNQKRPCGICLLFKYTDGWFQTVTLPKSWRKCD